MHEFNVNIFLLIASFHGNPNILLLIIIACYVVTRLELCIILNWYNLNWYNLKTARCMFFKSKRKLVANNIRRKPFHFQDSFRNRYKTVMWSSTWDSFTPGIALFMCKVLQILGDILSLMYRYFMPAIAKANMCCGFKIWFVTVASEVVFVTGRFSMASDKKCHSASRSWSLLWWYKFTNFLKLLYWLAAPSLKYTTVLWKLLEAFLVYRWARCG